MKNGESLEKRNHWKNWKLGGGLEYFLFSPLPGDMIQFDSYF